MDNISTQAKVIAAIVAIALGLYIFEYGVSRDDPKTATSGCALTAGGVTAIAIGLSRGQNAKAIIGTSGPALSGLACSQLVGSLVEDPKKPVPVVIQLGGGSVRETEARASDFVPPSLTRSNSCFDWIDTRVEAQCLRGEVSPPLVFR